MELINNKGSTTMYWENRERNQNVAGLEINMGTTAFAVNANASNEFHSKASKLWWKQGDYPKQIQMHEDNPHRYGTKSLNVFVFDRIVENTAVYKYVSSYNYANPKSKKPYIYCEALKDLKALVLLD